MMNGIKLITFDYNFFHLLRHVQNAFSNAQNEGNSQNCPCSRTFNCHSIQINVCSVLFFSRTFDSRSVMLKFIFALFMVTGKKNNSVFTR